MKDEQKEKLLEMFLEKLNDNVFIKSTNSVTDEEEYLLPIIEDMEAVIVISGEWDREDLKNILGDLSTVALFRTVRYD